MLIKFVKKNNSMLSNLQSKAITITSNGTQTITADSGYDGLSSVGVTTNVSGGSSEYNVMVDTSQYVNYPSSGILERIKEVNIDTSTIRNFQSFYSGCKNLEEINALDMSGIVVSDSSNSTSYMFEKCSSLKKITGKVILFNNANSAFSGCSNLENLPEIEANNLKVTTGAFSGCTALKQVPLFDTSNVTSTMRMFYNCRTLTTIPLFNTTNSTSFYEMFSGCSSLTTIPILNTSKVTDMYQPFTNCSALSNESLNNILAMCIGATSYTGTKTLRHIGLSSSQATTCTGLSNWAACEAAGWTTGY